MRTLTWVNTTAIAAGTAYSIPATAGLLPNELLVGVISVTVAPGAVNGTASTVSPFTETAVALNTTNPAAGQVSLQTTGANAQKLISGDAIPAEAVVTVIARTQRDGVIQ